ncbi:hypothetical protein FOL47_003904, partial [Perkinsus chesapeaki]
KIVCDQLICYVDASKEAWGVDVRTIDGVRVRAKGGLFSKEKRDKWTIPRKELLALIYGRDLLTEIWKSVPVSKRSHCSALFLTDSQINCYRLHKEVQSSGTKAWEIKNIEALRNWFQNHKVKLKHVVTNLNSADAITRGVCDNTVTSADIRDVASWWIGADCVGEAPWGPTVDFKFEEGEGSDEGDTQTVEEKLKGLDHHTGEDHDEFCVLRLEGEPVNDSLEMVIAKHRRLLEGVRRWKAKAIGMDYEPPSYQDSWISLIKFKQSQATDVCGIRSVLEGKSDGSYQISGKKRRHILASFAVCPKTDVVVRRVRQDRSANIVNQVVVPSDDSLVNLLM